MISCEMKFCIFNTYLPVEVADAKMSASGPILAYRKNKKIKLSNALNIVEVWDIVGPIADERIAGPEYEPVPYLADTNAYQIGNIFVEHPSKVRSIE